MPLDPPLHREKLRDKNPYPACGRLEGSRRKGESGEAEKRRSGRAEKLRSGEAEKRRSGGAEERRSR